MLMGKWRLFCTSEYKRYRIQRLNANGYELTATLD